MNINNLYKSEIAALRNAIHRCHSPKNKQFADYGGRGIEVCAAWRAPDGADKFIDHIKPKPRPELTLDRIDNERGYEPGNVRWATRKEQQANRRPTRCSLDSKTGKERTLFAAIDGITKSVREWAEDTDIPITTIIGRLNGGITGKALVFRGRLTRRSKSDTEPRIN